jgi:tRNA A37 threonylcarbamoyltransferase TsaD
MLFIPVLTLCVCMECVFSMLFFAAKNLVLCGGVALNSVLNGKIMRHAGYDSVYITNHPGVSKAFIITY